MDMSYFCAFFMLEDKDLKFASCQLDYGVAGFGTIGGGAEWCLHFSFLLIEW
jgi:hypothetical protein